MLLNDKLCRCTGNIHIIRVDWLDGNDARQLYGWLELYRHIKCCIPLIWRKNNGAVGKHNTRVIAHSTPHNIHGHGGNQLGGWLGHNQHRIGQAEHTKWMAV